MMPRRFDLNAPIADDIDLKEHDLEKDKARLGIEEGLQEQIGDTSQQGMAVEVVADDCSKVYSSRNASSITVTALFQRPFEPAEDLSIDEDLDILFSVWKSFKHADAETLDSVLAEACKELVKTPVNPDKYHYLSCIYVSKKLPESFSLPKTFKALLTLLSVNASQLTTKRQSMLPVLASKLLVRAFDTQLDWPVEFIEIYLEDAVGPRCWVDHEGCKELAMNISTAFMTKPWDLEGQPLKRESGSSLSHQEITAVKNRYKNDEVRTIARQKFLNALQQFLGNASVKENPRQLIRFLIQGSGYEEVRVLGSSMLEGWLNNPIHLRAAKSLLDHIVEQTHGTSENDLKTISNLLTIRITSLQAGQIKSLHGNIYSDMVTHILRQRAEYANLALKTLILAELNGKNVINLKNIATVLKAMPGFPPPEQELALVIQEQAVHEDLRVQLKEFARRMMKHIGQEINVHALCHGLLQPWSVIAEQHDILKEGWLTQLVDLSCQFLLHAAAPFAADEGFFHMVTTICNRNEYSNLSTIPVAFKEKMALFEQFSIDVATFQMEAMAWCTDILIVYLPKLTEARFKHIVQQFLFLEDSQVYTVKGENHSEVEINSFSLLTCCTRAPEEILARVILMGISNGFPLTQAEALNIIEKLVWRAAGLRRHMSNVLHAESTQLPLAIFKLSCINLPGIPRPLSAQLALKDTFWRASLVVLIVAVENLSIIGKYVWENIPTLQLMMKILVMSSQNVLPVSYYEVLNLEDEQQEEEAVQKDIEAEDSITTYLLEKRKFESSTCNVDADHFPLDSLTQEYDDKWKGNVMIFNLSHSRRPPVLVIEEVHRAGRLYQLGHGLRDSKYPDFFFEVIRSQELKKAWLWLHNILPQEPDLIMRLPLSWQCQLLHKSEGMPPTYQKNAINFGYVQSSIRKIITQGSAAHDVEINETLEFLSQRLASPCSAIRSQSRRCFAGIFNSSNAKELQSLQVPKRMFLVHSDESIAAEFPNREDLSWLDTIDQILSYSKIIDILVPNICTAVQRETSLKVVITYLNFLKKHLPRPPSPLSLVCCIANLVVQRKMLKESLLLGIKRKFDFFMQEVSSPPENTPVMVDLFLKSITEALRTGIEPLSEIHVPGVEEYVTLILPCYNNETMDQTQSRVKVQKVIVDAAVEIISLIASGPDDRFRNNSGYAELLNILFPGFMLPRYYQSSQGSNMAWIEIDSGNQLPLLSEQQALALVRTKDCRLVDAGLSVLSPRAKIQLCSNLGLSATAATALLQELDCIADSRQNIFQTREIFIAREATKLRECVSILFNSDNKKGSHFLQLVADSSYSPLHEILDQETSIPSTVGVTESKGRYRDIVIEDIAKHVFLDLPTNCSLGLFSSYFHLRKFLQESNIFPVNHDSWQSLQVFTAMFDVLKHQKNYALPLCMVIRLFFPLLVSCIGFKIYLSNLHGMNKCCNLNENVQSALHAMYQSIKSHLDDLSARDKDSSNKFLVQTTCALNELNFLVQPQDADDREQIMAVDIQKNQHFLWHDKVANAKVESELHKFMHVWLHDIVEGHGIKGDIIGKLVELVQKWKIRIFCKSKDVCCEDDIEILTLPSFKYDIAAAGCHGLVVEFLKLLTPKFTTIYHIECLFSILLMPPKGLEEYDLSFISYNFSVLLLGWIVHETSWIFITEVFNALLKDVMLLIFGRKELPNNADSSIDPVARASGRLVMSKHLVTHASALLEFVNCIIHHPRVVLSQYEYDQSNFHETYTILMSSIHTPTFVRAVCDLTVIISSASKIVTEELKSSVSLDKGSSDGDSVKESMLCQSGKLVLKVLSALGRSPRLLHAVFQELYKWERGICLERLDSVFFSHAEFSTVVRSTSRDLLWRVYLAFPLCFSLNREYGINKESPLNDLTLGLSIHSGIGFHYGQSSFSGYIIHNALLRVFKGSGKEVDIAYGICHNFARQHPILFLPHVPLLSILLKELLPGVRGETEVRNQAAQVLTMGLSFLHALRPHLFISGTGNENLHVDINNASKSNCHFSSYLHLKSIVDSSIEDSFEHSLLITLYEGLESLLSVYFEFLQSIEAEDAPQFAKVVARLADFLSHCVASDRHFCEFVASYWGEVLKTAAGKFSKIKKLSFLLSLLERSSNNQHLKTGALMTPTLPLEEIQKVQKKLLYFSYLDQKVMFEQKMQTKGISWEDWDQRQVVDNKNVDGLDLLSTIVDLENASARLPTILPILEDGLIMLTQLNDTSIRERIYGLLERLLVECPSEESAKKIGEVLVQQLSSPNATLSRTAVNHASRFLCYCTGYQELILLQMFQLRQGSNYLLELIDILLSFGG